MVQGEDSLDEQGDGREQADQEVVAWTETLRPFLDSNPESRVARSDDGDIHLERPWGDSSVVVELSQELVDDLNALRLFPTFSGMYHLDTGDMEFIFGPVPEGSPYRSRTFEFDYSATSYTCEFAPASERLRRIAQSATPAGPPRNSFYRNLVFISPPGGSERANRRHEHPEDPISFWIREAPLDQEVLVEISNHINFYMRYYDPRTPMIVVHEPDPELAGPTRPKANRPFPNKIAGASIDPVLLGFWQAAMDATDPARALLHHYQILEYGAFYHIDQTIRIEAVRLLKQPDALSHPELTASRLLDVLARENREEHEKLYRLFRSLLEPEELWDAIRHCAEHFTRAVEFDGGFEIEPLLAEPTKEDFLRRWDPHVAKTLRHLRNALVHGRERREVDIILPTRRNHELLKPWVIPAEVAASRVMVFAD